MNKKLYVWILVGFFIWANLSLACLDFAWADASRTEYACFAPGTKIAQVSGAHIKVENIQVGDIVLNPLSNKVVQVAKVISAIDTNSLVRIGYGEFKLEVSQGHPMIVERKSSVVRSRVENVAGARMITLGEAPKPKISKDSLYLVKRAGELVKGEKVLGQDGKFHEITLLKHLSVLKNQMVYHFSLKAEGSDLKAHAVGAEGFITGDFVVEQRLRK